MIDAADDPVVVGTDLPATGAGIFIAIGAVVLAAVADLVGGPVATRVVGTVLAADVADAAVAGGLETDAVATGAVVGLTVVFEAGVAI